MKNLNFWVELEAENALLLFLNIPDIAHFRFFVS